MKTRYAHKHIRCTESTVLEYQDHHNNNITSLSDERTIINTHEHKPLLKPLYDLQPSDTAAGESPRCEACSSKGHKCT